jgi:poly-beta-hydroxybutyrate-responsive repressor
VSDDQGRRGASGDQPPPRSWLTPYLLMLLRSWQGYGYELVRQLALFGFGWVEPGTVYRALRDLERDGYVLSHWDTSAGAGPARRVYTITDAGIEALGLWATTLESYRQLLERFFHHYGADAASATTDVPAGHRPPRT